MIKFIESDSLNIFFTINSNYYRFMLMSKHKHFLLAYTMCHMEQCWSNHHTVELTIKSW